MNMRKFIKKLQEIDRGSREFITDKELAELKEFFDHKGYKIVTENNSVGLVQGAEEHIIDFRLTEHDAVKLYKTINPTTFTRKTPLKERYLRR